MSEPLQEAGADLLKGSKEDYGRYFGDDVAYTNKPYKP